MLPPLKTSAARYCVALVAVVTAGAAALSLSARRPTEAPGGRPALRAIAYEPRRPIDTSGFLAVLAQVPAWEPRATLEDLSQLWTRPGYRGIARIDKYLERTTLTADVGLEVMLQKVALYLYEGDTGRAHEVLEGLQGLTEKYPSLGASHLFTLIYLQGVSSLRRGEDDNCVLCRGASSCILPIDRVAVHANPAGSRQAVAHFTEYLRHFPDDLEVRWLLNLAHMTLGEHPDRVDPRFVLRLDRFYHSEFDIGRFRDIGHLVGVNRLNQSGGAIMEDFDNDGLLDLVVTTMDATQPMAFYRSRGDGTFEDRTAAAGLSGQVGGGLYCVQGDYNNDGHMDIFICRGAWLPLGVRPSLLRNNGDGTFTDITAAAGLGDALCSNSAAWADYDNDGFLDLFVCCEHAPSRLYRNRGDGTFEEVAARAGVQGHRLMCKGAAWIDFDNDGYPDLFLNHLIGSAQFFRNNRDGTFTEATESLGIDGPTAGFSCWAWDYDNDGWLDIFAASYDRTVTDVVKGLLGQPHERHPNKLFRNLQGKRFKDVTREAGLDLCFSPMGTNFGDFDNDGYLDMYLGTGDPNISMLVPNRMFKNVAGRRFAEITGSSGTGHLQKGHAVACGDWDRNGEVDIFIEMGGAINGDKYHNVLFQNPGQGNHWLTVKLVGKKTNRAAIGARIKAVTAEREPLTVHRHITSGSSFGANPLQQTIGLAKAQRVELLEIHWPTSGTTQVFRNVAVNQAIEATEFAADYRRLPWEPVLVPK